MFTPHPRVSTDFVKQNRPLLVLKCHLVILSFVLKIMTKDNMDFHNDQHSPLSAAVECDWVRSSVCRTQVTWRWHRNHNPFRRPPSISFLNITYIKLNFFEKCLSNYLYKLLYVLVASAGFPTNQILFFFFIVSTENSMRIFSEHVTLT